MGKNLAAEVLQASQEAGLIPAGVVDRPDEDDARFQTVVEGIWKASKPDLPELGDHAAVPLGITGKRSTGGLDGSHGFVAQPSALCLVPRMGASQVGQG